MNKKYRRVKAWDSFITQKGQTLFLSETLKDAEVMNIQKHLLRNIHPKILIQTFYFKIITIMKNIQ